MILALVACGDPDPSVPLGADTAADPASGPGPIELAGPSPGGLAPSDLEALGAVALPRSGGFVAVDVDLDDVREVALLLDRTDGEAVAVSDPRTGGAVSEVGVVASAHARVAGFGGVDADRDGRDEIFVATTYSYYSQATTIRVAAADAMDAAYATLTGETSDGNAWAAGDLYESGDDALVTYANGIVRVSVTAAPLVSTSTLPSADVVPLGDTNGDGVDELGFGWRGGLCAYDRLPLGAVDPDDATVAVRWRGDRVVPGDIDGDGYGDLVTSLDGSVDYEAGRVAWYAGPLASTEAAEATISGTHPRVALGSSMAVGDVDGDGTDDLVLGAPGDEASLDVEDDAGAVWIAVGTPRGSLNIGEIGRSIRGATGDGLGWVVAAADLDGDGRSDIMTSDAEASWIIPGSAL